MDPQQPVELAIDGVLDLHTFSPRHAKDLVHHYLDLCREKGILHVRIIHGKGTGAMRELVHAQLKKRKDIAAFGYADAAGGGWGATVVRLCPKE